MNVYFSNITQKATPTDANHLVTKGYVDNNKLDLSLTVPEWTSGESYDGGDYVRLGNICYHCLSAHTASNSNKPGVSATYWETVTIEDIIDQKITASITELGRYTGTFTGDGTTVDFNVVHNLNSLNVITEVYNNDGNTILPSLQRINANTIQIQFGKAPTNGTVYHVVVTSLDGAVRYVDTSLGLHSPIITLNTPTVALQDDVAIYEYTTNGDTTFVFDTSGLATTTGAITFELYINYSGSGAITFPSSVWWLNNETPVVVGSATYMFSFRTIDGGTMWLGCKQGVYNAPDMANMNWA